MYKHGYEQVNILFLTLGFYVMLEKSANLLQYNFFQKLLCIMRIVDGDIRLHLKHCCALLSHCLHKYTNYNAVI